MYSELIMTSLFFFTLLQQPSRDGNLITHKICLHHWSSVTIQTHNMMAKRERVWKGRIETRNLKSTQPTSNNNKHKSFSSTQSLSISYFLSRQKFQFHGVLNIYVSGFFLFILLVVHRPPLTSITIIIIYMRLHVRLLLFTFALLCMSMFHTTRNDSTRELLVICYAYYTHSSFHNFSIVIFILRNMRGFCVYVMFLFRVSLSLVIESKDAFFKTNFLVLFSWCCALSWMW